VSAAFNNFNLTWLVGLAGLIFAPWTALMYVIVFPLRLGLALDWPGDRLRYCQLRGRLPQPQAGAVLPVNSSVITPSIGR